jgi:hypothetical protein
MTILQMSLLENAYDFLDAAIDRLLERDESAKHFKYAILHLASAIELLLKKCLYEEHWSLVFADINKANKSSLESGDFKSVYFDDAVKRLEDICQIDFTKHKSVLASLKRKRNEIEHYHLAIDENEAMSMMVKTWSFVIDFVAQNIEDYSLPENKSQFDSIRERIGRIEQIVRSRLNEIDSEIQTHVAQRTLVIDCPICLQCSLLGIGDDSECLFCRRRFSADSLEKEWLRVFSEWNFLSFKDKAIEPELQLCPNCKSESLYEFAHNHAQQDIAWACFTCGEHWDDYELGTCDSCGCRYVLTDEDIGMCDICIDARINQD